MHVLQGIHCPGNERIVRENEKGSDSYGKVRKLEKRNRIVWEWSGNLKRSSKRKSFTNALVQSQTISCQILIQEKSGKSRAE